MEEIQELHIDSPLSQKKNSLDSLYPLLLLSIHKQHYVDVH